jgi:Lon protease-like protein
MIQKLPPGTLPLMLVKETILLPGTTLCVAYRDDSDVADLISDGITNNRFIGIVQARSHHLANGVLSPHRIGTAGRITKLVETYDGSIHATISGVCRFRITQTHHADGDHHMTADVSCDDFLSDLKPSTPTKFDREALLRQVGRYLQARGIKPPLAEVQVDDILLVNYLAISCPFPTETRQLILEAVDTSDRANILLDAVTFPTDGIETAF